MYGWDPERPYLPFDLRGSVTFSDGNTKTPTWDVLHWVRWTPTPEDIDVIYSQGYLDFDMETNRPYTFKPFKHKHLKLKYDGYRLYGREAVFFYRDNHGHQYPVMVRALHDMIRSGKSLRKIEGYFSGDREGENYGIRYDQCQKKHTDS